MLTLRALAAPRRVGVAAACLLAAATVATSGLPGAVAASPGQPGLVAAANTPHLRGNPDPQTVKQLAQCGSTMYAVGAFSAIAKGSTKFVRNNAFSFSAVAPYKVTTWDPDVDGTINTIAFAPGDCSVAYIGGKFTHVGSTAAKNIAAVDTTTGAVVPAFKSNAKGGPVQTIAIDGSHVLVGGEFTKINGATNPYFASLKLTNGVDDGYVALAVSGNYSYVDDAGHAALPNPTRVYRQEISPDGTKDLVVGDFTTIGGKLRQQVAIVDLNAGAAATDAWNASEFNGHCKYSAPMYAQSASWSPDGNTVYVATTGTKPANGPGFLVTDPRAGLCDAASAFPAPPGPVSHLWINYTGCDSLYATAANDTTVFIGGHERYASNSAGCDAAGPGALSAPGMGGLSATDGSLTYNPTRDRGLGADDLLLTDAGLWVASDNDKGSNMCGGVANLAGICFLPNTP